MKPTLLPVQILLSIFSPTLRQRFAENAVWEKEYPEMRWAMSAEDKRECHQQFKDLRDPESHRALIGSTIEQRLIGLGYPVKRINVTTEDGYILGLYRIPFSPKSPLAEGVVKKAVVLLHGLLSNGFGLFALGIMLADLGFDVYFVNCRGTDYSQGHINPFMTLDNWKYWDFSFHEMGVFDIPAVIDTVTDITKQESMYFVSISMGATLLAVMLAERPEYNKRVATAFLLGPSIYAGHAMLNIQPSLTFVNYFQYISNTLLAGKLDPKPVTELLFGQSPIHRCSTEEYACGICSNIFFSIFGYEGPHRNYTTMGHLLAVYPVTTSTKTYIHFLQLVKTDKFCQFNYGFGAINKLRYSRSSPSCYDMDNISSPLLIFWAANDVLAKPQDIAKLVSKIPKTALKECIKVDSQYFTHMDFAIAKDSNVLVYKRIIDVMLNATYG